MSGHSLERGFRRLTLVTSLVLLAFPATWLGVEVVSALRRPAPSRVSRLPGRLPADAIPLYPSSRYIYTLRALDPSGKEHVWEVEVDQPASLAELDSAMNHLDASWKEHQFKEVTLTNHAEINLDEPAPRRLGPAPSPTRIGRVWHLFSTGPAPIALALSLTGFAVPWCVFLTVRYIVRGFKERSA